MWHSYFICRNILPINNTARFLMQRAEQFIVMRRRPVDVSLSLPISSAAVCLSNLLRVLSSPVLSPTCSHLSSPLLDMFSPVLSPTCDCFSSVSQHPIYWCTFIYGTQLIHLHVTMTIEGLRHQLFDHQFSSGEDVESEAHWFHHTGDGRRRERFTSNWLS